MDLPAGVLTDDLREVIDDPEIEVVAQLMGGLEPRPQRDAGINGGGQGYRNRQ